MNLNKEWKNSKGKLLNPRILQDDNYILNS